MHSPEIPELSAIQRIVELGAGHVRHSIAGQVQLPHWGTLPIHTIVLGSKDAAAPTVGFFGGIHGLERIGTEVVTTYLHSLVMRLAWDDALHRQLESVRLVFMPLVNPGGMLLGTRANPRGVDLMRNAPVQAQGKVPFLAGGQRWSSRLPWFRGDEDVMEAENQAVARVVRQELMCSPFSLTLDCHSGFGLKDRIWFPYAHSAEPIHHLAEIHALKEIFFHSHSHHRYLFEPQSLQYLAHGDVWDHLYMLSCSQASGIFLPLTLEMGSWIWVKKNPRQLFSRHGMFNPLIEHRLQRVLRQHQPFLDFLTRAALSYQRWLPQGDQRVQHHASALQTWY